MAKSFIESVFPVLAVLALASCSKAEEFQTNSDSALQIESVSGISTFALMQEPASKAVITGDSLPGDEATKGIGLFVTAEDGSAYDGHDSGYSNVKYTYNGSKWNTTTPIYLSGSVGNLYGYFPYNPDATDLRAIPVESSLNGMDYLYANPMTVSHSDKTVDLQMKHALSRLHLTIKKGKNFTAEATLSEITLKSTAIDATGTMDLTTGAITPAKLPAETGKVDLTTEGEITVEGIEKDILIVPAGNSEGKKDISIFLVIAGKPAGITLSGENGIDIRSGIQNNVILTIEDTGIKITGVDVGVWGEGGSQQVQVGKHTVTVKLDDVFAGIDKDIWIKTLKEDNKVVIKAFAESKLLISCLLDDNTTVHPESIGQISVFTISDITSNITATVGYQGPESIILQLPSHTTYVGCSFNISATVLPDNVYKEINWSSNAPSVATVDENGRVTAKAVGSAILTATSVAGGKTGTCIVTVKSSAISKEFSVGPADNCKKVRFSRGNLRYTPSIESWWFFDKQYECGPSSYEDGHNTEISLFTWGFGDWSTMPGTKDYEKGSFTDWGKEIGEGNTWRTFTTAEWQYLIWERPNAGNKVGLAKVCGMNGILILPDDFEDPKTNESWECAEKKFVPSTSNGWSQNIYFVS